MLPVPEVAYAVLARVHLHLGEEALVVARRKARMHRDHVRRRRNVDDRREIGERVVGELGVDRRVGGGGRDRRHAERIAVGCGARGLGRADRAAATGPVLDDHRLRRARRRSSRADDAGDDVGRAAGRERNDQPNRLRRIRLRRRDAGRAGKRAGDGGEKGSTVQHGTGLLAFRGGRSLANRCRRTSAKEFRPAGSAAGSACASAQSMCSRNSGLAASRRAASAPTIAASPLARSALPSATAQLRCQRSKPMRRIALPSVARRNSASSHAHSVSSSGASSAGRTSKSASGLALANLFQGQTSWQSSQP